ncbi:MAG TPA: uracil-DNA glycosylase family protein [Gemmatimonas sp.]|nr:uracil-DNA glycosylase family protein [Gemmatimonas sp.]
MTKRVAKKASGNESAVSTESAGSGPGTRAVRIIGNPVPPLVPKRGAVHVLLVGEAPGPRGADKSGVPFFGDAAGQHLYAALRAMGAVTVPEYVDDLPWDGEIFADGGLCPTAHGIALGNAYDRCPTDDGIAFRAPSRAELASEENVARILGDITRFSERGLRGIVTMGRVAATTIDLVLKRAPHPALLRRAVVHPSARGLLSLLPGRGSGVKMAELQERWKGMVETAVREAGYSA